MHSLRLLLYSDFRGRSVVWSRVASAALKGTIVLCCSHTGLTSLDYLLCRRGPGKRKGRLSGTIFIFHTKILQPERRARVLPTKVLFFNLVVLIATWYIYSGCRMEVCVCQEAQLNRTMVLIMNCF